MGYCGIGGAMGGLLWDIVSQKVVGWKTVCLGPLGDALNDIHGPIMSEVKAQGQTTGSTPKRQSKWVRGCGGQEGSKVKPALV